MHGLWQVGACSGALKVSGVGVLGHVHGLNPWSCLVSPSHRGEAHPTLPTKTRTTVEPQDSMVGWLWYALRECSQEGLVKAQRNWASHRLICLTLQWLHWPSVFYIFGSLGVLWYFVWEWRSASAPDEDDRCSQAEKDLLAKNTVERVGPMHSCVFRIPVQASDGV